MITDLDIALMLRILYQDEEARKYFDHYEKPTSDDGVCWAYKKTDDANIILLRGSTTPEDWIRDMLAITVPWPHETFGPVHPGFYIGMELAFKAIWDNVLKLDVNKKLIIGGHSLGAGRAALLNAICLENKLIVTRRVPFGEPKPGFKQLAEYLSSTPVANYRNIGKHHHDLVTDVPLTFPPEDYVHSSPLTDVSAEPAPGDTWGVFAYHHIELYIAGLKAQ